MSQIDNLYTSDSQLQNQLVNGSYGGDRNAWLKDAGKQFFGDINNIQWARKAMEFFSLPIPAWNNNKNWDSNQYRFVVAAKMLKKFNLPFAATQADCSKLKQLKLSLEEEVVSQTRVEKGVALDITNGILSEMKAWANNQYATLDCDNYQITQTKETDLKLIQQATDTGIAGQKTSKAGIYAVYTAAVLLIGFGAYIIFKPKKAA